MLAKAGARTQPVELPNAGFPFRVRARGADAGDGLRGSTFTLAPGAEGAGQRRCETSVAKTISAAPASVARPGISAKNRKPNSTPHTSVM